ncbi:MAG: sortase [Anaerolineaceae bacterium]|nr:MAG: sortase [Anaerolineaceae bacterium]
MFFASVRYRLEDRLRFLFQAVLILIFLAGQNTWGSSSVSAAPMDRPLTDIPPSTLLDVPAEAFIGENVTFTVTFDNTDTVPGYGPLIDLIIPTNGPDGAPDPDGLTFLDATYLGIALEKTVITVPGSGCVTHPYMVDSSGASIQICSLTPGDTFVALRLPFGSFTPDQPPLDVTISTSMSNLADLGTPLTIQARGGYQFGYTPTNDWCCGDDPSLSLSGWTSDSVTPILFTLSKSYSGPEDETATGPNFPRQYTVTATIAPGQTMSAFNLTDALPNNMQFLSLVSTNPGGATCTLPSTSTPGGMLSCDFASVSGTVTMTLEYFIPLRDASNASVIDPASGNDVTSCNNASGGGMWTPIDPRDTDGMFTQDPAGCEHTLTDKSIAIQKSVSVMGGGDAIPGKVLEYTLDFQISDFFAFQNVVITDLISDGQHFDSSFTPTLQINGNSYTLATAAMNAANYTVDTSQIGNTGPNPPPDGTDGSTTLTFRVSDEIITRGQNGKLIGGCVPTTGTGGSDPDCGAYDDGSTTGTITFRTVIQQNFTDTYPSGDSSVDQGDTLNDNVVIDGVILSTSDVSTPTGNAEDDDSAASVTIGRGVLTKFIYAVNGSTSFSIPVEVKPGDTLTYRLAYTLPTGDVENLSFDDYLPLPVFHVNDPDENGVAGPAWTFDPTVSAAAPAAGVAKFGPSDTFYTYSSIVPTVTSNVSNNRLNFLYGNFDGTTEQQYIVDIIFTVTVSDDPFADRLYLTNQAHAYEGSTNAGTSETNAIVQIVLTEPALTTTKSVVATDDPSPVYSPPLPVAFTPPGSAGPRWSGTINSNLLTATPIDSNISGLDAGDLVTFAIFIENSGSSINGAFDIVIQDVFDALGFTYPTTGDPSSINLQIYYGSGSGPISYTKPDDTPATPADLFGGGIKLVDPVGQGVCYVHDPNSGNNIIVITYDLRLQTSIAPGTYTNTGTLTNYSGSEGGPNFLPEPLSDDATVTVETAPTKSLRATSEAHTGPVSGTARVTIGEIVRYRLLVGLPEGISASFQIRDSLPLGLTYLEGTATLAFVSGDAAACPGAATITSSDPSIGSTPWVCGDETNISILAPTFVLPASAVSNGSSPGNPFSTGNDPYFNLGTLTNADSDVTTEYILLEFNALVDNTVSGSNDAGDNRTNNFRVYVNGVQNGLVSNSATVRIAEPLLSLSKSAAAAPSADAGDTVTYTLVISAASGNDRATAFDLSLNDTFDAYLTGLSVSNVATTQGGTCVGNGAGTTAFSHDGGAFVGNALTFTATCLDRGNTITITVTATIVSTIPAGYTIPNTANVTWTSLPATGTSPNGTGSTTPGGSGAENGERSNGTAPNDYLTSSSANVTIPGVTIAKQITATSASHTSGANLAIGEEVTYDILLTFPESVTPADTVVDNLPTGLEIVTGTPEIITAAATSGGVLANDFNGTIGAQNITVVSGDGGSVQFDLTNVVANEDGNDTTNNTILLRFRARVTNILANQAGTVISNEVTNQVGANPATTSNSVDVTVVEPELEIVKTVDNAAPGLNQTFTYTLTIQHLGSSTADAFDLNVSDPLPAGVTVSGAPTISDAPPACAGTVTDSSAGNNISLTVASLPLGCVLTIQYSAQIASPPTNPGDAIVNTASFTWNSLVGVDPNERTGSNGVGGLNNYIDSDSETVTYTAIDLQITKDDGGITSSAGGVVTYTLNYANNGNSDASGVTITDDVPANTTFTAGASTPGWSCADGSPAGTICTFTIGNLVAGGSGSVNFAVMVDDPLPAGVTQINNTASITDDGAHGTDTNLTNNTDDDSTPVVAVPDLQITKDDGVTVISPGQTVTYTLTISNVGTQDATGVVVTDTLPVNTTFISASDGGTESGGVVTWPAFDLAAGAPAVTRTVTIQVNDPFPGSSMTNLAHVEDDGSNGTDPTPINNDDDDTDSVLSAFSKSLIATNQAITPDPSVAIGEILTYEIVFTVPAGGTMPALTLTDTLDRGLSFLDCVSVVASDPAIVTTLPGGFGDACNAPTNPTVATQPPASTNPADPGRRLVFDLGNVSNSGAGDGTISIRYQVVVLDSAENQDGLSLNNSAVLAWATGSLSASAPNVTIVEPDFELEKTADQTVVLPGGIVTFTLTFRHTNLSNVDAFDVVLKDILPTGLTYVDGSLRIVSGPAGGVADDSAAPTLTTSWPTFPLLTGAARTEAVVEFQAKLGNLLPGQKVTNTASLAWTSLPGNVTIPQSPYNGLSTERFYDPLSNVNIYGTQTSVVIIVPRLPNTGFAPGVTTAVPPQPAEKAYTDLGDFWLEIPSLNVKMPIVGIPAKGEEWDLTWLWDQAGWLEGTAYPTHEGNSAITAHVYLPNGQAGPFFNLGKLSWGTRIIVHLGGQSYVYEVRQVRQVSPYSLSALGHQELPYLTLITCREYDEASDTYRYRIVVEAVLISVED